MFNYLLRIVEVRYLHPASLAHFNISKFPLAAALVHVSSSQSHPFARSIFSASSCLNSAAAAHRLGVQK
jgi:hypothetical protein